MSNKRKDTEPLDNVSKRIRTVPNAFSPPNIVDMCRDALKRVCDSCGKFARVALRETCKTFHALIPPPRDPLKTPKWAAKEGSIHGVLAMYNRLPERVRLHRSYHWYYVHAAKTDQLEVLTAFSKDAWMHFDIYLITRYAIEYNSRRVLEWIKLTAMPAYHDVSTSLLDDMPHDRRKRLNVSAALAGTYTGKTWDARCKIIDALVADNWGDIVLMSEHLNDFRHAARYTSSRAMFDYLVSNYNKHNTGIEAVRGAILRNDPSIIIHAARTGKVHPRKALSMVIQSHKDELVARLVVCNFRVGREAFYEDIIAGMSGKRYPDTKFVLPTVRRLMRIADTMSGPQPDVDCLYRRAAIWGDQYLVDALYIHFGSVPIIHVDKVLEQVGYSQEKRELLSWFVQHAISSAVRRYVIRNIDRLTRSGTLSYLRERFAGTYYADLFATVHTAVNTSVDASVDTSVGVSVQA